MVNPDDYIGKTIGCLHIEKIVSRPMGNKTYKFVEGTCLVCGETFTGARNSLFCSDCAKERQLESARKSKAKRAKSEVHQVKCNECGVVETELQGNKCNKCGIHICDVDRLIDIRAYNYAAKHNFLYRGRFVPEMIRKALSEGTNYQKAPLYISKAASSEGIAFNSLKEMPPLQIFRCCKDSNDKTFRVGALVYRAESDNNDGIVFPHENGMLPADECDSALEGAAFEDPFLMPYEIEELLNR